MESKTEQELRKEFEKIKNEYGCIGLLNNEFKWFQKGYSLAQETIEKQKKEIETLDSIIKYQLDQLKAKDATIAELESRLEQSVDISVVNELNETIKAKDAEVERLLEQHAKDSYKERAGVFDNIIERKNKAIAEARCIIQTSLGFCGVNMAIENEKRANEWLKENKK